MSQDSHSSGKPAGWPVDDVLPMHSQTLGEPRGQPYLEMGWTPHAKFHHPRKTATWQCTKIHPKRPEILSLCFNGNLVYLLKRWTRITNLYDGVVIAKSWWQYEMSELQAALCCGKDFSPFCFPSVPLLASSLPSLPSTTSQIYPVSTFPPLVTSQASADPLQDSLGVLCPGLAKSVGARSLQECDLLRKCPDHNFLLSCSLETPSYFNWESPITFRCFGEQSGNGPFYRWVNFG